MRPRHCAVKGAYTQVSGALPGWCNGGTQVIPRSPGRCRASTAGNAAVSSKQPRVPRGTCLVGDEGFGIPRPLLVITEYGFDACRLALRQEVLVGDSGCLMLRCNLLRATGPINSSSNPVPQASLGGREGEACRTILRAPRCHWTGQSDHDTVIRTLESTCNMPGLLSTPTAVGVVILGTGRVACHS